MGLSSRSAKSSRGRPVPADLVTVGRVVRPHGLRGEVRVRLETDFPQRFERLREVYLIRAGRVEVAEITGRRPFKEGLLLTIHGIGDLEAAEGLRGAEIAVPRDAVVPLEEGAFYVFEIVGLRVRTEEGRMLGTVAEVIRAPANDVYVVRGEAGEILLPATREVVRRIDPASGEMVVALLPGLEEPDRAH
ncbi:MAG: ribosome maturation factor RimM [bacterium]|nr:ribosome maturation factor RimM [bacterium]